MNVVECNTINPSSQNQDYVVADVSHLSNAADICDYLVDHGEIAETTNNILIKHKDRQIMLQLTQNMDEKLYKELEEFLNYYFF